MALLGILWFGFIHCCSLPLTCVVTVDGSINKPSKSPVQSPLTNHPSLIRKNLY